MTPKSRALTAPAITQLTAYVMYMEESQFLRGWLKSTQTLSEIQCQKTQKQ